MTAIVSVISEERAGLTVIKLVGVIAGIVFAAVGIWLLIHNLRAEAKKHEAAQEPEKTTEEEGDNET